MIAIIDYGVGNIKAFANIYKKLNIPFKIVRESRELVDVERIVLPGVGAFDHAMSQLNSSGMRHKLDDLVLEKRIPVIGICVGMQMLAKSSDEGGLPGLGWIDAHVKRFDENLIKFKTHLPHMGWNDIELVSETHLLKGLETNAKFYFLHSYYFECHEENNIIAKSDYGIKFCSVVNKENIFGAQFHPEKSHDYGIKLLGNFAAIQC